MVTCSWIVSSEIPQSVIKLDKQLSACALEKQHFAQFFNSARKVRNDAIRALLPQVYAMFLSVNRPYLMI